MSPEPAASSFRVRAGECRSASVVVSHREPSQTPCAPSASTAAICSPLPMPPAARTGSGATASTASGVSTMVAISPVWPPASYPCATTTSMPASAVFAGVAGAARQGGDEDVLGVGALDHVGRG